MDNSYKNFFPTSSSSFFHNSLAMDEEEDDELEEERSLKKVKSEESGGELKKKKKIRKRRFAFETRSQVDVLDDGYRWRKYGQKAVKNNKFPRFSSFNYLFQFLLSQFVFLIKLVLIIY